MTRLIALLIGLFALPALAAEQVTTFTLDNGMEVVVIEDHRVPVVVHMVWYRAGSADETPGVSGVAHYLEHLMFNATETLAKGEFSDTVSANGGSDNAFTSYDYTAYYQRVAADRLPLMMQMEADRMRNIQLTESDIETERGVILEERNQRTENSPYALAFEQIRAVQFMNHRYGVPIIGWRHEIETIGMDDLRHFYDLYYSPNNATLVVAGDVTPDEVRELAETYYGPIPANPDLMPRERTTEPPHLAERRLVFADPRISEPYLSRTYLAPERDPGDQVQAAALVYLAEILGGSPFTSVLGVDMQFDAQIATYTSAWYDGLNLDDGSFGLVVIPAEGVSIADAEAALDASLANFLETGIDAAKMERLRTQFRASEIYALDNMMGLAERYGSALSSGLTVQDVQDWPDILQSVTEEDILAAAELILRPENAITAHIVPNREALQ